MGKAGRCQELLYGEVGELYDWGIFNTDKDK
jgi:hypothetical protein